MRGSTSPTAPSSLTRPTPTPRARGTAAYAGYQGLVASGYNFSAWDGPGIVTTRLQALLGVTTVAVATAAEQVLFIGPSETAALRQLDGHRPRRDSEGHWGT